MPHMFSHRRTRILGHTRDYIARLGSRQEALQRIRERDLRQVEDRMTFEGRLAVDFLASNASMLTAGEVDLGSMLAAVVGAEREGDAWPDMVLDVRLTVEVLKSPPAVADTFLDG